MRFVCSILFMFFATSYAFSQEEDRKVESFDSEDDVILFTDLPRSYTNYFSEYLLDDSWGVRLEKQERVSFGLSRGHRILEYATLSKFFITDRYSILFGPKLNILKKDGEIKHVSPTFTFGQQYDITERFSIEGRIDNVLGTETYNNNIQLSSGAFYKLSTRFKF